MMKKILTLFLALAASVGTLFAQSGTCGDNLTWNLNDGTLTITGTGSMKNYTFSSTTAPWYSSRSSIKTVIIEDGVTSIGGSAFYNCSSLTSVTIGNSVTSIGQDAFFYCSSLTSVTIGNSVTSIGRDAFSYCSSLTSITIPNSVTSIGYYAFLGCSSLPSITVDYGNPNYCDIDGVLFNKNKTTLILYPEGKSATSYIIPNSVTSIGVGAFCRCSSLTSVIIPNSVTSIEDYAFSDCSGLTSVTIPNSVTSIGEYAFSSCISLTSILVDSENPYYCDIDGVLFNKNKTTLIRYPEGKSATSYIIPNSVTKIGGDAFSDCSSLTSVTIPNSVTSIGDWTFYGCSSLTSITIPNSVTSIGYCAFCNCTGLTSVTCEAVAPPTLKNEVFDDVDKSIPLYVPAQSIDLYKAADQWKDFTNILPITSSTPATFTITFLNYDGSELQSSEVEAGTMPQYNGTEPTKPADAQYTYTFAGWDKEVVAVTGDATYTALFVSVFQCSTIETTDGITVWEDQLPYTWEGISFTTAGTETKTLQASDGCDSIVTFTLHVLYRNITLQENESADYYTQFAQDYNGRTVNTATLNRQFTQGKWATLCLPFNVNKAMMMSLGLYNRVFAFRYARQLDDETIQVFFTPAQSIEAGKGYIVNPNAKLAAKTSFVFPNVTINTDSDNGDITTLTGYNDGTNRGNLWLVGTLRTGILQGTTTGNTYLGLKDNQLYYPNTTPGPSIRAYRGFFRSDIPVNASRVRIIADGEPVSELQVVGTDSSDWSDKSYKSASSARKYLRNGLLFIERNGITYTAQGQRLD